ncbi:MAG TPA: metallophosphoesterase family protein [Terriglobales bacterium]|nr:metallophosphoesterase family protein [Terriglobales bacterium]
MTFTIGVISDTHGLLRPEAVAALAAVDHILHAGDVGDAAILNRLRAIAPLTAIRGNVDVAGPCGQLPANEAVELAGKLFYLVHAIDDLDIEPQAAGAAAVIYGHSHRPAIEQRNGVLYLNPGSAGPRRFHLPVTLAKILVADGALRASIVPL